MPIDPRVITSSGDIQGLAQKLADFNRKIGGIAAARVTIGDGTIGSGAIAGGSITASHIQAGSITASHIQADAINAGHIQANAITTDEIAANTIIAGDIQANTITSNEIAAASIIGADIQASTITASNIVTGTLVGSLLASATITGDKLVAATITADRLNVSTLSAITANLGTVTAGIIQGATFQTSASNPRIVINSSGISAADAGGAVNFSVDAATGKIVSLAGLGTANLVFDSGFEQATSPLVTLGYTNATGARVTTQKKYNNASAQLTAVAGGNMSAQGNAFFRYAVSPSKNYAFSAWVKPNTTARSVRVEMQFYNGGATTGSAIVGTSVTEVSGDWVRPTVVGASPSNATNVEVKVTILSAAAGEIHFTDAWQLQEGDFVSGYGARPEEILAGQVEGGGGAGQIKPTTIIAGDLLAHTITANEIAASTITAVEIAAVTITAGKIVSGTITAAQIAAGTITADRLSVATLSAITANMGTLTAGTITGGTIQTAVSGNRVALDTAGLKTFNSSGAQVLGVLSTDGSTNVVGSVVGASHYAGSIDNTGFEVNTTGWTAGGYGIIARDTTQHDTGVASLKVSPNTGATWGQYNEGVSADATSSFGAGNVYLASHTYIVQLRVKSGFGDISRVMFNFGEWIGGQASGNTGNSGLMDVDVSHGSWYTVTFTWTPEADLANTADVRFGMQYIDKPSGLDNVFIDNIQIYDTVFATERQYKLVDSLPTATKMGAVTGQRFSAAGSARVRLESTSTAPDTAGSTVELVAGDSTGLEMARLLVRGSPAVTWVQPAGIFVQTPQAGFDAQRHLYTLIDADGDSDFMLARGEHIHLHETTGTQSIPNNGNLDLSWNSGGPRYTFSNRPSHVDDMYLGTFGNTEKVWIQKPGIYILNANIHVSAAGGFGWFIEFVKNSTTSLGYTQNIGGAANSHVVLSYLEVDDFVTCRVTNQTGAAITVAPSAAPHEAGAEFSVSRLGDAMRPDSPPYLF